MNIQNRQRIEREIVSAALECFIAQGFKVQVDNGEEYSEPFSSVEETLKNMFQTDEEYVYVLNTTGRKIGWVQFVYGNDGWDVICNYTTNLEKYLTMAQEVSEKYQ
jgi:uncharacterized protein YcgL (UPF0745 family)